MLDLDRLERLELASSPVGQRALAMGLLLPNYNVAPGVDIEVEGLGRIPDEPVIYAMNHTDRFNYWPFQYTLWCRKNRYTATWVKGKYFQNPVIGQILEWTNNIPAVSKGYLVARDFLTVTGRKPTDEEYRHLREAFDRALAGGEVDHMSEEAERASAERYGPVPAAIYERDREILGMPYSAEVDRYGRTLARLYRVMMGEFVRLNEEARRKGLDLLIFPEGTRSRRLTRGKIGLAQMALHLEMPVVPVGCNGSDKVYPGASPVARSGRIVYRVGEPLGRSWLSEFRPEESFEPFTPEAEGRHGERFRRAIDGVMERIDGLLDPEYQAEQEDEGGAGRAARFV